MVAPAIPAESGSPWLDSFVVKPRTQDSFFAASTQAIEVGATFDKNMQQLSAGDTATPVYVCAFCSKIKSASYFCYFLNIAEVKTQEGLSGGGGNASSITYAVGFTLSGNTFSLQLQTKSVLVP